MIIVEPSVELLAATRPINYSEDPCSPAAIFVERTARVCWKSEGKATPGSAAPFLERILKQNKHESIAEHASATVLFVTDRIVSHQIVRHRIAAYSQESTHYINYGKRNGISVCRPIGLEPGSEALAIWTQTMENCERAYLGMIALGAKHYTARYALPMALKTELVATWNFRTWQHVLRLRTAPNNTPEIINLMRKAGRLMANLCPEIFGEWA